MPEYTILDYRAICLSSNSPYLISLRTRVDENRQADMGWVWFMPDDQVLPPAHVDASGRINLYYHQSRFSGILELLRTERPVQVFFETGSEAGLRTSRKESAEDECLHALFSHPWITSLAME